MGRLILGLSLLALLTLPAVFAFQRPASAAFAGINGKIVFRSERKGNYDIFVMDSDGSGQTNLTQDPAFDVAPAWSPDGSKIAFESLRSGSLDVWVMDADGSNMVDLSNNPSNDVIPAWSPDGTRIAFASERDGNREIYVMNADGTNQTRITNDPAYDTYPAWSPDGTKIGFHRTSAGAFAPADIYVINVDGTGETQLTTDPADDRDVAFSPDGTILAYSSLRDGNYELYTMAPDGSAQTRLLADPNLEQSPEWSPDGAEITFISLRDNNMDIYKMAADGTNVVRLTTDPAIDQAPNWQAVHDSDGDGCYDTQEVGLDPAQGGMRDPQSFWDFFDTPNASNVRDRSVSGLDFFAVLARFGSNGETSIDPLTTPSPPPAYHTAFDRSPALAGMDAWDLGPPNGAVSGTDFFALLAQFGHTCE